MMDNSRMASVAVATLAVLTVASAAYADNCSGLHDCEATVAGAAVVASAIAALVVVLLPGMLESSEAAAATEAAAVADAAVDATAAWAATPPGASLAAGEPQAITAGVSSTGLHPADAAETVAAGPALQAAVGAQQDAVGDEEEEAATARDILQQLVQRSQPGQWDGVRELTASTKDALDMFGKLASPGTVRPHPNPQLREAGGYIAELPGGGTIGFRPFTVSGPPTIDLQDIAWFSWLKEVKCLS